MTAVPRLFVRQSSGLVRTISAFGAMVFGVHCISLSSSGLIPFSWVASVWPGASIIGVLTVAMLLGLFHAYSYAAIGAAMPRSGADYVLGSRVLHPTLAFAASWVLGIFSGIVAGGLIAWIPGTALPTLARTIGIVFQNQAALDFASWSASSTGILVIGTICVLVTWMTMLLPTQRIVRILEVGFFLGVAAWIVIFIVLATAPGPSAFQEAWDRFMGPGSYASRIDLAVQAGMEYSPNVVIMTLAGLIMGFWIYYGYYIPTFFAGEVKDTQRNLLIGAWASLLVTWAIFSFADILLERLVPLKWIAAEGYLYNNTETFAMPWITFYASILAPNPLVVGLITLAWVYTLINLAQTYFFYTSRIIFSWAFDRIIPSGVAYVHPRWGSPVVAVSIIALLAWVGVIDAATRGILATQLHFVFFAVITQLVPVLALTLLPFLKPQLWATAPRIVRAKVGPIPVITLVGGITLVYLVWMIVASFLFPAVGGGIGMGTLAVFAVLFLIGAAVQRIARWYRLRQEGIDLAWTFREIPPV